MGDLQRGSTLERPLRARRGFKASQADGQSCQKRTGDRCFASLHQGPGSCPRLRHKSPPPSHRDGRPVNKARAAGEPSSCTSTAPRMKRRPACASVGLALATRKPQRRKRGWLAPRCSKSSLRNLSLHIIPFCLDQRVDTQIEPGAVWLRDSTNGQKSIPQLGNLQPLEPATRAGCGAACRAAPCGRPG